jgi:hypothetical protein
LRLLEGAQQYVSHFARALRGRRPHQAALFGLEVTQRNFGVREHQVIEERAPDGALIRRQIAQAESGVQQHTIG